jgi:purine nucleosidase
MIQTTRLHWPLIVLLMVSSFVSAKSRRTVIIDEDFSGPGGSNLQTLLVMVQSPQIAVLGVTVVSGDQWRDEEVAHTLRLLEIIGRTDIPVVPGAVFPLVRRREDAQLWQQRHGKVAYGGAWDDRWWHEPFAVPALPEGQPTTKPADEDAAHFLLRMVHEHPHEVTIYEGGPMTNLALAVSIDPHFAELAQGLVFMGGSLSPQSDNPEWVNNPRHEFNFWFDPEAAQIVLRARWKKIVCTPTDISVKTRLTPAMVKQIETSGTPIARYIGRFYQSAPGADIMWDELAAAAWIDPSLITKRETRYMSVNLDRGAGYGDTLTWSEKDKPALPVQPVEIQVDLDTAKFSQMFVNLMSAPTPHPHGPDSGLRLGLRGGLPFPQRNDKLLNFVALALGFLFSVLGQLFEALHLLLRFRLFSGAPIDLGKTIVRLFQLRTHLDCLLIGCDGSRKISAVRIENAQLQIRDSELRVEMNGFVQQSFDLRQSLPILSSLRPLAQNHRIVIVGPGIFGLKPDKARHPLYDLFGLRGLDALHFAEKQVRSWIAGIEVRRLAKALGSLIGGAASIPRYAQADQHPDRAREQAIAPGKDFDGGFRCAMRQQFGSPIE